MTISVSKRNKLNEIELFKNTFEIVYYRKIFLNETVYTLIRKQFEYLKKNSEFEDENEFFKTVKGCYVYVNRAKNLVKILKKKFSNLYNKHTYIGINLTALILSIKFLEDQPIYNSEFTAIMGRHVGISSYKTLNKMEGLLFKYLYYKKKESLKL